MRQCYCVAGETDFVVIVTAADMADYERFTMRFFLDDENIRRFRTSVAVTVDKFDTALPFERERPGGALGGDEIGMLGAMQRAYHVEGRNISDLAVLTEVAVGLGHDGDAFDAAFESAAGAPTRFRGRPDAWVEHLRTGGTA